MNAGECDLYHKRTSVQKRQHHSWNKLEHGQLESLNGSIQDGLPISRPQDFDSRRGPGIHRERHSRVGLGSRLVKAGEALERAAFLCLGTHSAETPMSFAGSYYKPTLQAFPALFLQQITPETRSRHGVHAHTPLQTTSA